MKLPDCSPDTDEVRRDFAEFYGAIAAADTAVGQLLDVLAATGLDTNTWVVFVTDYGAAFPRAMSTLYDSGTGIALIVRPPRASGVTARVYDELFSGVDLLPTLLGLLWNRRTGRHRWDIPRTEPARFVSRDDSCAKRDIQREGLSRFVRHHARAVRTKDYSYIETYHHRPSATTTLDIQTGSSVKVIVRKSLHRNPNANCTTFSAIRTRLGISLPRRRMRLQRSWTGWRPRFAAGGQNAGDVVASEHADAQLAEQYAGLYWQMHNSVGGGQVKTLRSRRAVQPHGSAPRHD